MLLVYNFPLLQQTQVNSWFEMLKIYLFIALALLAIPSIAVAHSGWQQLAYLTILIPVSFLPLVMGLYRIVHDEKKYEVNIKGSVFTYLAISLITCIPAILLFTKIGIIHYFSMTTIGPLLGFVLFQVRLKTRLEKDKI